MTSLFAAARQLIPGNPDKVTVTIEAPGVRLVLEDPRPSPLSIVEQAIALFLRDPNRSLRSIAAELHCSHSSLSESPVLRLRHAFAGVPPRGAASMTAASRRMTGQTSRRTPRRGANGSAAASRTCARGSSSSARSP